MVVLDEDSEPQDLAIEAISTEALLRIVGTARPRYGETLIVCGRGIEEPRI